MSLRVLHVLDHSWPVLDGYAQRSRSIVLAQRALGLDPVVLTSPLHQIDDPSAADTTVDGIRYFRTHVSGFSGAAIRKRWPVLREVAIVGALRKKIEALLASERFDIVHAHSPALCGLAASRVSRNRRPAFVYEIRSFWEDSDMSQKKSLTKKLRYRLGRDLETLVTKRADAVVGIAQSILRDLRARGIDSTKLHHVPNGVDAARFTPRQRDTDLAARLAVDGLPTLGFIGTLFPWEGTPWLVRAAANLRQRCGAFKLLIIGDGAEGPEVKRAIEETKSADFISFIGRVPNDQIERYYSVLDVLIYPRLSVRITEFVTPLKPLEAMALGKAILASGVGGIRELIEPEMTGLLFESENMIDFCRQASRLLGQADLRQALGARARQTVAVEKDWNKIVACYEAVYDNAIRRAAHALYPKPI